MEKKYTTQEEVIDGKVWLRVTRISDGLVGGLIERVTNLSHEGTCFVYGNVQVFDSARVFGDAQVFGSARVFGDAQVFGSATVFGSARVYDNATVFGSARVYANAQIYGWALVHDNARVHDDAQVYDHAIVNGYAHVRGKCSRDVCHFATRNENIAIADDTMVCGCQFKTIEEWLALTPEEIARYPSAYRELEPIIRAMIERKQNDDSIYPS